MDRTILHSDMNSCYASIELLHRPELRGKPMAVGGDPEKRHGIILAKNDLAKKAGVKTGMALWEARMACPDIVFVPPDLDLYMRFSRMAQELYGEYTDQREPFGIDESWLDVTASSGCKGDGMMIAQQIRERMKRELGVTVSIGVSWNKIFAKFGSDYKKPDAITEISRSNYREIVWNSPVEDLLFVGSATSGKLRNLGIYRIGQIAQADPWLMQNVFGKMGLVLHAFAAGEDQTPVNPDVYETPIKSIGNGITTPRDLRNEEDVRMIVRMLSESISRRLKANFFECRVVEIGCRGADLSGVHKQHKIDRPTDLSDEIAEEAMRLFRGIYDWKQPIRSLDIRAADLVKAGGLVQLRINEDELLRQKKASMDQTAENIRDRFGYGSLIRGNLLLDTKLTGVASVKDHEIHPHGYFESGNRTGI